jgi:hypothetical protein
MARAKLQAPEVARHALASVDAGELYSLPHSDGAWLWRLKRLAPGALLPDPGPALLQAGHRAQGLAGPVVDRAQRRRGAQSRERRRDCGAAGAAEAAERPDVW